MRDTFRHEALFYADADEFLAGAMPFLREALEAGEPATVAVAGEKADLLAGELGADAAGVRFVDMESLGRNPARIIPFWQESVDERDGAFPGFRGVGEPIWPGRGPAEIDECERHESLLNHVFAGTPAWRLLCPYDEGRLDDEVLRSVHRNHPFPCESDPNRRRVDGSPDPFAGSLEPRLAGALTFDFDRSTLHEVRSLVGETAERRGLTDPRCADLVTAASELAANSVLHGGGHGTLAAWENEGTLLVEVEDGGWIEQPMVGRVRPDPTQVSGRGLWLANQFCDLVQIRSGPGGTTIRLHMSLRNS